MADLKEFNYEVGSDLASTYTTDGEKCLRDLSKINIFLGPNSSGKSRFLRSFFAQKEHAINYDDLSAKTIFDLLNEYSQRLKTVLNIPHATRISDFDFGQMSVVFNGGYSTEFLKEPGHDFENFIKMISNLDAALERGRDIQLYFSGHSRLGRIGNPTDRQSCIEETRRVLKELRRAQERLKQPLKKIYIPTLRGLRPIGEGDVFKSRTLADYFMGRNDLNIVTGLNFYDILDEKVRGYTEDRNQLKKYEEFLERYIFHKKVTLIPKKGDDCVSIKIGNESDHPIYKLGDGVQQLIIITYPMFFADDPTVFYIEEPDLYLHPGLQRRLFEVLLTNKNLKRHQFFFTTHSNHFLDMTLDFNNISVYSFTKSVSEENHKVEFQIEQCSAAQSSLLRDIGVKNSSVFLTNATIWVEGISDRIYLRYFLKKYFSQKNVEWKEDKHYSFVEYQGSNLPHFTFDFDKIDIKYLCSHGFFILDGDVDESKPQWKDKLDQYNGSEGFHIIDGKETENLIPDSILRLRLKQILEKSGKDLTESNITQICDEVSYGNRLHAKQGGKFQGIGAYLDEAVERGAEKFRCKTKVKDLKKLGTETGTINAKKADFARKMVKLLDENASAWEMTGELEKLCRKIEVFIEKQNSQ
jgi:hypothetical protein